MKTTLVWSCAASCFAFGLPALAQDSQTPVAVDTEEVQAEDEDELRRLEDVIVTGRRGAIIDSLSRKQDADNFTDILTADQAGRFPDNTAAEALSRLAGVTFQRETDSGEGEFVSIRGLDSALNTVEFDGIASGAGGVDSGNTGGSRRAELDGIDAADVSEIRVNKSLLPEHEGAGIGGLVSIITRSPLDREDSFALNLEGRYSEFADETGYRIAPDFNYSFSDTFAVRGSASFTRRYITSIEFDTSGGALPLAIPDFGDAVRDDLDDVDPFINSDGILTLGNALYTSEQLDFTADEQVRDTWRISGAADWQVSPQTRLSLRGRWSRSDADTVEQTLELDTDDDYEFNDATGLYELVLDDQEVTFEGEIEDEIEENAYITLKGETEVDRWTFDYQLGYSRIHEEQPIIASVDFQLELPTEVGIAPLTYDPVDTPTPIVNLELLRILGNPGATEIFDYDAERADEETSETLEASFDTTYETEIAWLPRIQAGVLARNVQVDRLRIDVADSEDSVGNVSGLDLGPDGSLIPGDPGTSFLLSDTDLLDGTTIELGDITNVYRQLGIRGIPRFNRDALLRFANNGLRDSQGIEEINFINAEEDIYAAYIQGAFEFDRLEIVAGVRVEAYEGSFEAPQTSSLSGDFAAIGEDFDFDTSGGEEAPEVNRTAADNVEWLPRLQANYRFSDELVIRGAWYTSIARPTFQALSAETDIDVTLNFETGDQATATLSDLTEVEIDVSTGNPDLDNAYANNFDLGLEYYFSRGSAVTAAVFYKEIDNFIFVNENADFGDAALPDGVDLASFIDSIPLNADGQALLARLGGGAAIAGFDNIDFDVSRPRNGQTAEVYGIELGFVHLFDYLPAPFDGFGFYSNLTLLESEADVELGVYQDDDAAVLLGLAEEGETFVRSVPFFNSPEVASTVNVFYEKGPLEASVTYAYQDASLNSLDDYGIDQYDAAFEQVDLNLEFDLTEGFGDWFAVAGEHQVYFRVTDLTDDGSKFSSFQTFGPNGPYSDFASYNGREFRFGLRSRF